MICFFDSLLIVGGNLLCNMIGREILLRVQWGLVGRMYVADEFDVERKKVQTYTGVSLEMA